MAVDEMGMGSTQAPPPPPEGSELRTGAEADAPKKWLTALFEFDVRKFPRNPFSVETAFGSPQVLSIGDVFAARDNSEEQRDELAAALKGLIDDIDFNDAADWLHSQPLDAARAALAAAASPSKGRE